MSKDTGGPAFPTVDANREADYGTAGITARDYFAARAPAMPEEFSEALANRGTWVSAARQEALWRYEYADAMLAERSKP